MDTQHRLPLKWYSAYQFSLFRIILGIYLTIHFISLIPYGTEVWSAEGMMSDPTINLTHGLFPNLLLLIDSPLGVSLFLIVLSIASLLFTVGMKRNIMAIILWYGWVCLFDRNNLIANPGLPFIGWLLLACAVIPSGEPLSLKPRVEEDWQMPKILFVSAWVIMALSYTISGIDKLMAPSWHDGSAILHLLENPLARDSWLRELLLSLPDWTIKAQTWTALTLEIVFLPLALFKRTRFIAWAGMTLMHFGIICIVDFADLTVGMLMMHVFTFDSRWMEPAKNRQVERIVFFDGVCGMCNETVDLLMKEDRADVLQFAPLQGDTAKVKIPEIDCDNMDSIIYYEDGKISDKSTAVLSIFQATGGLMKVSMIFRLVPRFVRDAVYNFIAKNRYAWFGKKEVCRMPTEREKGKLLF